MHEEIPASQERLLDAEAIEAAAATMDRPTARMHLEALAKKLRKESEALKRVESSRKAAESDAAKECEEKSDIATAPITSEPLTAATVTSTPVTPPPIVSPSIKYVPIDRFAFDAGGYNAPFVTLYIDLPYVGTVKDEVKCDFQVNSFDLVVPDLNGKSYRLFKDNLEKDIDPKKSKIVVKSDKIVVKLAKVKSSEYGGFDFWSKLTDNKKLRVGKDSSRAKDDPHKSIMQMMKDMYDEGDDNMRKIIGETMMKQQRGELDRDLGKNNFMDD